MEMGGGVGERGVGGGGGGGDLYKFLSWFMSVIFLFFLRACFFHACTCISIVFYSLYSVLNSWDITL